MEGVYALAVWDMLFYPGSDPAQLIQRRVWAPPEATARA